MVITVASASADYTLRLNNSAKTLGASKVRGESADYTLRLNNLVKTLGASKVRGESKVQDEIKGGESVDIDVNHDGRIDIRAVLISVTASYAEINFVNLATSGPTIHLLGMLGVGG